MKLRTQAAEICRILVWSARNPPTLSHARMMLWLWGCALLASCISIGGQLIGGVDRITWWLFIFQTGTLFLDAVMVKHNLAGYLKARAARDVDRAFRRLTEGV
jgi:hypothetical protein